MGQTEPERRAADGPCPPDRAPRILVAEDDPDMRFLVAEALQKDGYTVEVVSDGGRMLVALAHRCTDIAESDRVDLIVSDVRMPICTGLQIVEQLRAARWRVPIVLMTAFGEDSVRCQARSLGATLLDKPFDLGELLAVVARLLGR